MKRLLLFIPIFCCSMVFTTVSASGDIQAGEAKANQVCLACHGPGGNSTIALNPVLAGQVPGYLATQLRAFQSGARVNVVMKGMADALSDEDIINLDAYYAAQKAAPIGVPEDQEELALEGGRIYRGGYRPMSVSACMSCHGPAGHGIPPRFPRVSAQHAVYLEQQLIAFKNGERADDVMGPIAFRLSLQQIKALSLFMSGLQ